ncbi:MAG: alkaline phosphatase family protein, partial [Planctomycetes bacterium]|nr:alkaline phosphatase family protein [Planctomycetota bacterium]
MIRRPAPFPVACALLAIAYFVLAPGTPERAQGPRVIVLGLDGLDPDLLSSLMDEGALPNFSRLAGEGSFSRLGTTTPPQSPVAWSTFLTGANPGVHGVFDFVHRDPATYRPYLSTARTEPPECVLSVGDWRFPLDSPEVKLLRSGGAFWEKIAAAGHPVLALKVPADYPPGEEEGRVLAGMGVPDLAGTYGDFTYYTDRPETEGEVEGGRIEIVRVAGGRVSAELRGPPNTLRAGFPALTVPVIVEIDPEEPAAHIQIGESRTVLVEGEWSPWLAVEFDPGFLAPSVRGICRLFLEKVRPWFGLYVSPVNVDPRDPALPIARPEGFSGELAAEVGPFYTQGMAEETSGLNSGVLSDASYLGQAGIVLSESERLLDSGLEEFRERGGLLFFYVGTSDLTSHMFWRARDPGHPAPPPELPPGSDPIRDLYVRLDGMLGRV